jgi:hypothetical protein
MQLPFSQGAHGQPTPGCAVPAPPAGSARLCSARHACPRQGSHWAAAAQSPPPAAAPPCPRSFVAIQHTLAAPPPLLALFQPALRPACRLGGLPHLLPRLQALPRWRCVPAAVDSLPCARRWGGVGARGLAGACSGLPPPRRGQHACGRPCEAAIRSSAGPWRPPGARSARRRPAPLVQAPQRCCQGGNQPWKPCWRTRAPRCPAVPLQPARCVPPRAGALPWMTIMPLHRCARRWLVARTHAHAWVARAMSGRPQQCSDERAPPAMQPSAAPPTGAPPLQGR